MYLTIFPQLDFDSTLGDFQVASHVKTSNYSIAWWWFCCMFQHDDNIFIKRNAIRNLSQTSNNQTVIWLFLAGPWLSRAPEIFGCNIFLCVHCNPFIPWKDTMHFCCVTTRDCKAVWSSYTLLPHQVKFAISYTIFWISKKSYRDLKALFLFYVPSFYSFQKEIQESA